MEKNKIYQQIAFVLFLTSLMVPSSSWAVATLTIQNNNEGVILIDNDKTADSNIIFKHSSGNIPIYPNNQSTWKISSFTDSDEKSNIGIWYSASVYPASYGQGCSFHYTYFPATSILQIEPAPFKCTNMDPSGIKIDNNNSDNVRISVDVKAP